MILMSLCFLWVASKTVNFILNWVLLLSQLIPHRSVKVWWASCVITWKRKFSLRDTRFNFNIFIAGGTSVLSMCNCLFTSASKTLALSSCEKHTKCFIRYKTQFDNTNQVTVDCFDAVEVFLWLSISYENIIHCVLPSLNYSFPAN